jgi:hypothetical protein
MSIHYDVVSSEHCASNITENDVLLGRGKTSFNHPGNRQFRKFIAMHMDAYLTAKNRFEKSMVFNTILTEIKNGGGRFLQQKKGHTGWFVVDDKFVRTKISHAVRDAVTFRKANPGCPTEFPTVTSSSSSFQQVSGKNGEYALLLELPVLPSTRAELKSKKTVVKVDIEEAKHHCAPSLHELMTPNQMMMPHLKLCKEEFFSQLQLQHLLQQDQDQDLAYEASREANLTQPASWRSSPAKPNIEYTI